MRLADKATIVAFIIVVGALPAYLVLSFVLGWLEAFLSIKRAQVFGIVLISILLEAFPFVLLGSVLSGAIEVLVSPERLARFVPRSLLARLAMAPLLGIVFPVCECGVVPVVRRLIRKGLPLEMAVVYLLAGPITNPIVMASTAMAFLRTGSAWAMVVGRVALGILIAGIVGAVLAIIERRRAGARTPASAPEDAAPAARPPAHSDHGSVFARILNHAARDFLLLGGFLLLGAIIAAASQAFVPRTVLVSIGQRPILSSAGMMVLAFGLNLCSEADAFVAASFVQFSFASKLAFLVLGPMLDMKLIAMYLAALPRRVLVVVILLVPPLVLILSECVGLMCGKAP